MTKPPRASKPVKKAAGVTLGGIVIAAIFLFFEFQGIETPLETAESASRQTLPADTSDDRQAPEVISGKTRFDETEIRRLIDERASGEMVTLEAEIVKMLPHDNEGSRHQRILVALETGGTILIAHNIDLAPSVPAEEGDTITVRGEYEWNDKGGVIHWTHYDPKNWREGGWIEHAGERYE